MDFAEQLRVLQAAQGDPAKLALVTVDFAFPTLADGERAALKAALEAAAIPHWCDADLLAALLDTSPEASGELLTRLRRLTVVEPFPARGDLAVNVHEAARLALRARLAAERPDWFRSLSQRTAAYFAADRTPAGRIEWIYHRLCAAPEEAATELERLDREWSGSAHPEDRQALAVALRELADSHLVYGRARVWVLLSVAWSRHSRGETAQLGAEARDVLELAAASGDARALGDAHCLIGDVFEAQGQLREAQAAFGESLAISRRLAEQDPSNAGWQRDLAVAYVRIARVQNAAGGCEAALALYEEAVRILGRLVQDFPDFASWQGERKLVENELTQCRLRLNATRQSPEPPSVISGP